MKFALILIALSSITVASASSIEPKTLNCKVYDSTKSETDWPWVESSSRKEEVIKKVTSNIDGIWQAELELSAGNEEILITVSAIQASEDLYAPAPEESTVIGMMDRKARVTLQNVGSSSANLSYTRLAESGSTDRKVSVDVQCELK